MFGIEDPWIYMAYLLCIVSAALCVIYGAVTWNMGGDTAPTEEDLEWAKEEDKLSDEL